MNYKMIIPLLEVPIGSIMSTDNMGASLYELRCEARSHEGWFLLKCRVSETHSASMKLTAPYSGEWLVGKIERCPSLYAAYPDRFEILIHGGSVNVSGFCVDEVELVSYLTLLNDNGLSEVMGGNGRWEGACDDPFTKVGFTDRPHDFSFELLFGELATFGAQQ